MPKLWVCARAIFGACWRGRGRARAYCTDSSSCGAKTKPKQKTMEHDLKLLQQKHAELIASKTQTEEAYTKIRAEITAAHASGDFESKEAREKLGDLRLKSELCTSRLANIESDQVALK